MRSASHGTTPAEGTTDSTPRFPGEVHSTTPVAALSRRERALISTCVVLITGLAWVYLVHLDRQMSSSMEHDAMMADYAAMIDTSVAASANIAKLPEKRDAA